MLRYIKTPSRTLSSEGPILRFIRYFPCRKADGPYLPFDSLSSLYVGIFLEWRRAVVRLEFEAEKVVHKRADSFIEVPDYRATLYTGEQGYVEANISRTMTRRPMPSVNATTRRQACGFNSSAGAISRRTVAFKRLHS